MTDQPSPTILPAFTPVPRRRSRHDGWTAERQRQFIELLADYGSVRAAAEAVGMTPESAYMLRRSPGAEEFAAAWQAALDKGVQRIEDVAMDRALNGWEVPVYSYGKLVGTRRVFNDRLLMFMLRNRAPERFAADGRGRLGRFNAADKQQLARLKAEWRAEWDREEHEDEQEVLDSIDAFIDNMRTNREANMSPRTRAAWEDYKRIEAEESNGDWMLEGDEDEEEACPGPGSGDPIALPPPREAPEEAAEEPSGPRVITIKDVWD